MHRISSALTFINKRLLPGFLLVVVAFFAFTMISAVVLDGEPIFFVVVPVIFAGYGYFMMKMLIFDLMDEVYLDGNELIVRNKGDEERIPLAHVTNVNASVMTNPERITLTLMKPSKFGEEITFSPTFRWFPFTRHPLAGELMSRAQEAKKASIAV